MLKNYLKHFMGIPTHIIKLMQRIVQTPEYTNLNFISGKYRFHISFQNMFMNINLKTEYKSNLIVNGGRANFLNRLKDNTQPYIQGMGVGTGTAQPLLTNTTLTSEVRKAIQTATVDTNALTTTFMTMFTGSEINNTKEIGLFTSATAGQGTMISRSVHTGITMPTTSSVKAEYVLSLQTGVIASNWTLTSGLANTYEVLWASPVLSVIEADNGHGYVKKTSVAQVEAAVNSWYYDSGAGKLYVHSSNNADPDTHTMIVLSAAS